MKIGVKYLANALLDVFMPRLCPVCSKSLDSDEPWLCRSCMMNIPATRLHLSEFNEMEQLFAGKVRVEKASGYFWYEKGSGYANILHDIKYRNCPDMGRWLARKACAEMTKSGLWADIDAIVPVPLHRQKLAKRGYNQSEYIARGISDVLHVPVVNALCAVRDHATQTRKSAEERLKNAQGLYAPDHKLINELGKSAHLLIVDDVITTGATLISCIESIAQSYPGIRFSVFTLAVSRLSN